MGLTTTSFMMFLYWIVACLLRTIFVILNNLYCIPTYTIWMVLFYPLMIMKRSWYWAIEGRLFHWLLAMVALWSTNAGYEIVESGDKIDDIAEKETLVLVNHQSTSDVPILMAAFNNRPGLLPNLNWIMDGIFKYTNFGIVSALHGDFFIAAGRDRRDQTIQELGEYLKNVYLARDRKWLVLFPEGGFLRKRKVASQRYATKVGRPKLEHVTLPRMGAVQAIIDALAPWNDDRHVIDHQRPVPDPSFLQLQPEYAPVPNNDIDRDPPFEFAPMPNNNIEDRPGELKYLLDLTIAYPEGKPLDMGAIVTGYRSPRKVHLHYRVYPMECVPREPSLFQDWMYDRYVEKEKILAKYYETGEFGGVHLGDGDCGDDPNLDLEFTVVKQDLIRTGLLHGFFLLSTFIHAVVIMHMYWTFSEFF